MKIYGIIAITSDLKFRNGLPSHGFELGSGSQGGPGFSMLSTILEIETDLSEIDTALPEIETNLPEIETALPEIETALPEIETNLTETR